VLHSVRWRLVLSFIAISLVAVGIVGGGSLMLVRQSVELRETEYLSSNAAAVARQALPLMVPRLQSLPLLELAQTAAFMSDSRVRVLDRSRGVIADSGPQDDGDRTWIQLIATFQAQGSVFQETLMVPLRAGSRASLRQAIAMLGRVADTQATLVRRSSGLFGSKIEFQDYDGPVLALYEDDVQASVAAQMRNRFLQPIGNPENPVGFVEVARSPALPGEALDVLFGPFAIAALAATLLAGALGLFFGRRLTAPVLGLTASAVKMGAGDLAARAPAAGRDEVGELGRQFNMMASRLETTVRDLRQERDVLQRFIGDASHELRTPVTALKTFNALLIEDSAPDRVPRAQIDQATRSDFLRESGEQIDRMEWIVENLLSLSRLEAGVVEARREWIPVIDLVDRVIARFERRASQAGTQLTADLNLGDAEAHVDRAIVEIALGNILANAIRYGATPSGGAQVMVSARQLHGDANAGAGSAQVEIRIRDRGPGIAAEELPHIFDRFYRGRAAGAGGSGLGLAIARAGVTASGGDLTACNCAEPGWGAEFAMLLPARLQPPHRDNAGES
jgi:signal transduction histidine kinase